MAKYSLRKENKLKLLLFRAYITNFSTVMNRINVENSSENKIFGFFLSLKMLRDLFDLCSLEAFIKSVISCSCPGLCFKVIVDNFPDDILTYSGFANHFSHRSYGIAFYF